MDKIFSFIATILYSILQVGGVALHLYTILMVVGMHGFGWGIIAFCLPIASEIYCFFASLAITNDFWNTYSVFILLYLLGWGVAISLSFLSDKLSSNN